MKQIRHAPDNSTSHRPQQAQSRVLAVQRKNWEPLVLGPALAMDRIPGPVCFRVK